MLTVVERLVAELRAADLPISVAEKTDALDALRHTDLGDRAAVRAALEATLVKDLAHAGVFTTVFDLFFGLACDRPGGSIAELGDAGIRDLLLTAVTTDDTALLRTAVSVLVTRHAGIRPGRAVAGTSYLLRTMKAVDRDDLLARMTATLPSGLSGVDRRLALDKHTSRLDGLRQEVEAEIRRRLAADRGAEAVARTLRRPLPEDTRFLTAAAAEFDALRTIAAPLAQKVAAQLARGRRARGRGPLDVRRTVRRSLSSGGTPVVPVFRRPRPIKPELLILADISGSVAPFAAFTLHLAYALRAQFTRVRCFVFVDGLDEVTGLFEQCADLAAVARRINEERSGLWLDGSSDYGNAFATFASRHLPELTRRTTVLVLGDARTNHHAPRVEALRAIAAQAGHVYWLNPEPAAAWDSGDSVMGRYARACDGVFECRDIRQLRAVVARLGTR